MCFSTDKIAQNASEMINLDIAEEEVENLICNRFF